MASASYSNQSTSSGTSASSLVVRTQKRRGGALSCAECRRLKLKCSRVFPCSNCVKKGCGAICPDGALTTGKGNRFVLANTEALHEKISVLATRVRELEDGLAHAHSLTSTELHPLLSEELLQIKRPLERERQDDPPPDDKVEVEEATTSLGSLSISNNGRAAFFGLQANSWYLLQIEDGSDDEDYPSPAVDSSTHPNDIPWLSHAFPFSSPVGVTAEGVRQTIMNKLPRVQIAKVLCDTYYRHAAWMYTPITEQDFEVIFRQVYDSSTYKDQLQATTLTVFCMVLALGALLDLDKPPHSPEAMLYYHLGRAAMSIESVLEEHSPRSIQALMLMCQFMFLEEMSGPRWVLMGMAVKIAQSIGLHRDTGKWKVDPEQTQKRRELFYELLTYDSWQSLTYGRPPSFSAAHVDNQMPHPTTKNENGDVEMSYCAWKHRFTSQCLSIVHDQIFGARPPNYKVVRELDKKVRSWYIPPSLQVPGFGSLRGLSATTTISLATDHPTVQLTMQRYIVFAIREITLFYMHRGFFAQALRDNPADPMGSKFSHSVLAAYNSATSFVNLIESLFNQHPLLTERLWFLFTHVFSCSLVLGEIALKPNMVFARSALSQLTAAYNLFSRVTDTTKTGKILPILAKLKESAQLALTSTDDPSGRHTYIHSNSVSPSDTKTTMRIKSEVDDISALGGMTRLVTRRASLSPSVVSASSPTSMTIANSNFDFSPDSQSPTAIGEPSGQPYAVLNDATAGGSGWQSYTHIQNFNVNINMGMNGEYYNGGTVDTSIPPAEEGPISGSEEGIGNGMMYSMQGTAVHPHQQRHLQQHQLSAQGQGTSSGIGMALDTRGLSSSSATAAPEDEPYYMPFYGTSVGSRRGTGYGQAHYFGSNPHTQPQQQLMHQQPQQGMLMRTPHMHVQERQSPADLNDSWQSFMAQYKS